MHIDMNPELRRALIAIAIGTLTAFFASIIQVLTTYLQNTNVEVVAGSVASLKYLIRHV